MPYAAFRRQPMQQPYAQALRSATFPAPTRGIIRSENESFMQPGGAVIQDNWVPTMRGVKLRGGFIRWTDLHALDPAVPPVPSSLRLPVISAFEYQAGSIAKMFAANASKLFEVTANGPPVLVKGGQTSGNYCATQMANAAVSALGTNWLIAVNETGDFPLRFNGSTWIVLDGAAVTNWANGFAYTVGVRARDVVDGTFWLCVAAHTSAAAGTFAADRLARPTFWVPASDGASFITGPIGSTVEFGRGLSYVWKYRSRLYFIEAGSMNAWYLGIDSVGGVLTRLPLAGAATRGGRLMWGATWSLDAGDGIDEKCIFATDQGEVLIFTGTNPADAANWRQEGRYTISPPLGMNAHIQVGGDLLILTVDGIIPLSQAITKDVGQLELATISRNIKQLWREEVAAKRSWSWTIKKWDEYGGIFVTTPGDPPGKRHCLVANNVTLAFCRFLGYDATAFIRMRADLFFGTQDGIIMQADRTGYDDGVPYVATLVGGWETFGSPATTVVWHQARASFHSGLVGQPFQPQLSAAINYDPSVPPPPPPGPDPGLQDVWDQGLWGADRPWGTSHVYATGDQAWDTVLGSPWRCVVGHTSAAAGAFAADRAAHPTFWVSSAPPDAAEIAAFAQWDQASIGIAPVRNTAWISIGRTGFAHAPVVQVTVAQQVRPDVELIAISATYEPAGVNV